MKKKGAANLSGADEVKRLQRRLAYLENLEKNHQEIERELRLSEERYRRIFDHSNDAIFITDPPNDRIIQVNDRACAMLGYKQQELLSMHVSDIHPGEMPNLQAFSKNVFSEGYGWTNELSCLTKSGQNLPSEISASVVEIGGQQCLLALVRDITDRKKAENQLKESEKRFRLLVEHAGDALFLLKYSGEIVDVNTQACHSLKHRREDLLKMTVFDISKIDQARWDDIHKLLAQKSRILIEGEHRRKDGSSFPVEIRVRLFELDHKKYQLALVRDITERKEAQQKLNESQKRLSTIVESAMDAIMTVDGKMTIQLFNHAAEKAFGEKANRALGQKLKKYLSSDLFTFIKDYIDNSEANRSSNISSWLPSGQLAQRADGESFPVEGTISSASMAGKQLYTIIVRDIDERKKAEARLFELQQQNLYLQEELQVQHNFGEIIGQSSKMLKLYKEIKQVSGTEATVLISGETGTGKELIARAIHSASNRQTRVLVTVNCGALPSGLVESELFGHEKGAFTGATAKKKGRFELADKGTIFLDEVGELSLDTQTKLLRVLQEQEFERVGGIESIKVDVRVIAATNRNLEEAVNHGAFRPDLFYRLNIFPLRIPPLRDRVEDVPLLASYFMSKFSKSMGKRIQRISPGALAKLSNYDWRGNVRELANIMERAVIVCESSILAAQDIGVVSAESSISPRAKTLKAAEREHIIQALKQSNGVVGGPHGAAASLGLNRSTLVSRMKKLNINKGDY